MDSEYEELYKWIEEHPISRPKRNINRDFSDAIPLVEILKHHFPKLVELHNYSPKNAYAQKLINWEILNSKVLKKLKINLSKKKIDQLAKAEPGEIEKLLLEVRKRIDDKSAGDEESEDVFYLEDSSGSQKSFTGISNLQVKKVIPSAVLEKMKGEINEKNEAIQILNNKVEHLENLLNIKEERIKDLSHQLQSIVNQGSASGTKLDGQGKFLFNLF